MNIEEIFRNKNHQYNSPYIIAEVGVNHECNMDIAKKLINDAAEGGANAVKFQTYKASSLASKDSPAYWDITKEKTPSQFLLFQKYDKFWKEEFIQLKKYCDELNIEFMSTPFDIESAEFLNDLMKVYKISSSDINNKPFIEYLCKFKKPIILSTGASNTDEITEALSWIEPYNLEVAILHCILNYPTDEKNANLAMIRDLIKKFPNNLIGYSDHTLPSDMKIMEVATLLGCRIIEKHFTHNKSLPGNDHYHAMDKNDLRTYFTKIDRLNLILGKQEKKSIDSELISRLNARRSLVCKKILKKILF